MDKNEYNLKLDEINQLVEQEEYEQAARIADTVEWKRVRNARTLCAISEIYEANGRLKDSKEILLRAYQRSQIGRTVLYRLTEVAIKMKEFDEAVEYYSEFVNAAPNDTSRYILKYKIYRGRGSSLEDQISILEEYKEKEYTEKWAYELAVLYKKVGAVQKSISECDDLVLWFRQGKYVIKALELKKTMTSLTPIQQSIYDNKEETMLEKQDEVEAILPEMEKVILDKMPSSQEEALTENIISETQRELAQAISQHAEEKQDMEAQDWGFDAKAFTSNTKIMPDLNKAETSSAVLSPEAQQAEPMPSSFDAENLQQSLAESMHRIVSGIGRRESEEDIIEPMNDNSFLDEEEEYEDPHLGMKEEIPDLKEKQSIDDILTSMAGIQEESAAAQEKAEEKTVPIKDITMDLSAMVEEAAGVTHLKPETKPEHKQDVPIQKTLTKEQQYIFSYFSTIQGLRENIASALGSAFKKISADKTSKSGNIVITGLSGSGRTTLGIRFAKALSLEKGVESARVAKIYAEDFNKKDIASTIAKIAGGTLIIEEAGDLDDEVVIQLSKAMEFRTDGLIIILEDEKHLLKPLFEKHPAFAGKFTSEVSIPIFTNDELVSFGKTYAFDEDYKIDEMATLALYNRIGELQSPDRPVTVIDVKDIVDKAVRRSERLGLRKLGKILSHKRYDDEDRIVLYEKDFK